MIDNFKSLKELTQCSTKVVLIGLISSLLILLCSWLLNITLSSAGGGFLSLCIFSGVILCERCVSWWHKRNKIIKALENLPSPEQDILSELVSTQHSMLKFASNCGAVINLSDLKIIIPKSEKDISIQKEVKRQYAIEKWVKEYLLKNTHLLGNNFKYIQSNTQYDEAVLECAISSQYEHQNE